MAITSCFLSQVNRASGHQMLAPYASNPSPLIMTVSESSYVSRPHWKSQKNKHHDIERRWPSLSGSAHLFACLLGNLPLCLNVALISEQHLAHPCWCILGKKVGWGCGLIRPGWVALKCWLGDAFKGETDRPTFARQQTNKMMDVCNAISVPVLKSR